MKRRLDKLPLENFLVLRQPLESGRQSPESMAGIFLISPFLIGVLLLIINMFVFADRYEPPPISVIVICIFCNVIGLLLIILSIVFAFKKVFQKRERTQYFISIMIIQALIGFFYLIALYVLFDGRRFNHSITEGGLKTVIFILSTFMIGLILFVIAFIRFYRLLEKGAYKKNKLVIWYCKGRFKSFNFDENNEIYPLSTDKEHSFYN